MQKLSPGDPKVVVLGAGPTGLSVGLGMTLNSCGERVIVLEKKSQVGGLAGSFQWKKHTVDYGPHRLSPNIAIVRILAEELLGPDNLIQKSQHGVQFDGKLYQFPPRVIDWISPASLFSLVRFGWSFFASKMYWVTKRFNVDTFESLMVRKFGARFYKKIAAPMSEKVWIRPNQIDSSFVNQRFACIHPTAVLKKILFPKQELNPSSFYYPRKGYQQLWDNMANQLQREGVELRLNAQPQKIVIDKNRVSEIHYESKNEVQKIDLSNGTLVSTIPAIALIQALTGFDEQQELLELSKSLKFRSMILVALEFDQNQTLPFRTLIYPEKKFCFNRLFEQNEYSRETVELSKSVVVADITVPRGDSQLQLTDDEIIKKVKSDFLKLKYIKIEKLLDATVKRVEFAYVVPDVETRKALYKITHTLKKITNLQVMGRFAAGEYDNSDYAIDNGITLGAMISGNLSKMDYLLKINEKLGRSIVG